MEKGIGHLTLIRYLDHQHLKVCEISLVQNCFYSKSCNFLIRNKIAAEVFIDTQPLIRSVLDGYNVCIFAYGQTGSGKTFTMVRKWLKTKKQTELINSKPNLFF